MFKTLIKYKSLVFFVLLFGIICWIFAIIFKSDSNFNFFDPDFISNLFSNLAASFFFTAFIVLFFDQITQKIREEEWLQVKLLILQEVNQNSELFLTTISTSCGIYYDLEAPSIFKSKNQVYKEKLIPNLASLLKKHFFNNSEFIFKNLDEIYNQNNNILLKFGNRLPADIYELLLKSNSLLSQIRANYKSCEYWYKISDNDKSVLIAVAHRQIQASLIEFLHLTIQLFKVIKKDPSSKKLEVFDL